MDNRQATRTGTRLAHSASRLASGFRSLLGLVRAARSPFLRFAPPGHFYSPLPDLQDIRARSSRLFEKEAVASSGIDLREDSQLELLEALSAYYRQFPFRESPNDVHRYYYGNQFFGCGDAVVLHALLRHLQPRRIIEIGSGFSSAAMYEVSRLFLENSVDFTFIEPNPDRLLSLIGGLDGGRGALIREPVQKVPADRFRTLEANDILFVDSSHVVKVGSDVADIFFGILPELRRGVVVHVHDVPWPFEYPREWFLEGRAWNEAYLLRAFLQYNRSFEILYFNSFLAECHRGALEAKMPLCLQDPGSSIWLRRSG